MDLIYKNLFDIHILHDYFLKGVDDNFNSMWPENYNILNDLEIIPTIECAQIIKNYQIKLRPSPFGLRVFARAMRSNLSANNQDFCTFIYIPDDIKLTFLIRIKNASFFNFTNLRLTGNKDFIYNFGNSGGLTINGLNFISLPMPEYGTVPAGDALYQWGDMVIHNNRKYDAIRIIDPSSRFNVRNWILNEIADASYVTVFDRISQQSPVFTYKSVNSSPGETIKFILTDANNAIVNLGNIPTTNQPQDTFRTPANPNQSIFYRLNLGGIPFGKYTLKINRITPEADRSFYLFDPLVYRNVFGVIEIHTKVNNAPLNCLEYLNVNNIKESVIRGKQYTIRFRNRYTHWQYIAHDGIETLIDTPKPLMKVSSGYKHNGNENLWPVPEVNYIDPLCSEDNPELIEDILSQIYLNVQYKSN